MLKNYQLFSATCAALGLAATTAHATCTHDGQRTQIASLTSGDRGAHEWQVNPLEIHQIKLQDGFELGLRIEPAPYEKYGEMLERSPAVAELVKISLYDLNGPGIKLIFYRWAGANSMQGYGPRGSAEQTTALGKLGFQLWLNKATCVTLKDIPRWYR